jgi:predicted AAA+ superfamily ATPase
MKPWREVATPHPDVLQGTFQQSEFAADITAVRTGQASREYQDAKAFYERTFITEGMRLLLGSVVKRLNGKGGDPVIQLQTAFGGGKTHTMLAVYHLATRTGSLKDLPGVASLVDGLGVNDVPQARVAVIDGTEIAPGQPWKRGSQEISTLWGELAWQLGGEEAFEMVRGADANGTSPGKEAIRALLAKYSPCIVLVDELVAYLRQFQGGQLSGGTYDSNLSFAQSLTEAVKLVPNAMLLASLPESEVEAGSEAGVAALKALEKTFGRVQALWKPVATEEAFEIVRRRLFEDIHDASAREATCKAFADAYIAEGPKLPGETQEARYKARMLQSYPIHPEVFDRLYEDWSTLQGFQRTRGVLKLMAKVIYHLWKDQNQDTMILPASIPLYDGETRSELVQHLPNGWDPVLEGDIDGARAETTELENREARFGTVQAARRVARCIFLGSAPSSVETRQNTTRGMTRPRVLLGCLQPGQNTAIYGDALNRLDDTLHYLNSSGDKGSDNARYWFDTRANLRREMEDRKRRFDDKQDVRPKLAEVLRKLCGNVSLIDGLHVFTPSSDIPDDSHLRLVVLPPDKFFNKNERSIVEGEVLHILKNHGDKPRHRGNRLLFLAPDHSVLTRLNDAAKSVLAWKSILDDVQAGRLNIDREQENQAKAELQSADNALPRVARECFKWLLCPYMDNPAAREPLVEEFPLGTAGSSVQNELERICSENELIIDAWSPIHLRDSVLKKFYWKPDKPAIGALTVWEDMQRYFYLPRLRNLGVYDHTVQAGAASKDFFGTAYGAEGDKYEGFQFGQGNIQVDGTLLLIEPNKATGYEASLVPEPAPTTTGTTTTPQGTGTHPTVTTPGTPGHTPQPPTPPQPQYTAFHGAVDINPTTAKMKMAEVADEIISLLTSDPDAELRITLDISSNFPDGAPDNIRRAVSENANQLGFKNHSWE